VVIVSISVSFVATRLSQYFYVVLQSTIIALMERFYDPDQGEIELDGTDLRDLNVRYLRDQLGLVSQEPTLFDCSVADNITYGYSGLVTQEHIEEAAKLANAHDFIMSFPQGYDTQVGAGSALVSGGQKQRIALARALLRNPKILLLDEATSALDSESERIVQAALDKVMFREHRTCVVIAHRLSTVRNANRIAVIDNGKVRELGTHDQLMAKGGRYARLVALQDLHVGGGDELEDHANEGDNREEAFDKTQQGKVEEELEEEEIEVDMVTAKKNAARARSLASTGDKWLFFVGAIGALLAGVVFPAFGFVFAYMIEVLYTPVVPCDDEVQDVWPFLSCQDYYDSVADQMRRRSWKILYAFAVLIACTLMGSTLLFWGFGKASENMNKRVRDSAFASLLRQEVAWFDVHTVGTLTSQLAEDAALIHAFSGEPIRTLVLNLASVLVGVVVSFYFMWPFALLTLAILPFMAFGAEMEMQMYMGDDQGDDHDVAENTPGGILIETMSNIRTIAALTLEDDRAQEYHDALDVNDSQSPCTNFVKGCAVGSGQFVQMWGMALMFWWGGWLLSQYGDVFSYRDFLISMMALLFSLYGLAIAAQGAVNGEKAKQAAARIFALIDRESLIDPQVETGKKQV
jgi:ATP-binding cassette, subfamily B (MDR/TAP), member 1